MTEAQKKFTPALPRTAEEFMRHRRRPQARSLNTEVEQIHLRLWDVEEYQKYFTPLWREDTLEGSFILDESKAAQQVRDYARDIGEYPLAQNAKLASIIRSLHVVMDLYHQGRKERQSMVRDQRVSMPDDELDAAE